MLLLFNDGAAVIVWPIARYLAPAVARLTGGLATGRVPSLPALARLAGGAASSRVPSLPAIPRS